MLRTNSRIVSKTMITDYNNHGPINYKWCIGPCHNLMDINKTTGENTLNFKVGDYR